MDRVLDHIDRSILDALQDDGRMSIVDLAVRVNLTKTPCAERVRRLEREGYICQYHARLDPTKFDLDHMTVVHVTMSRTSSTLLKEFRQAVQAIPEIEYCTMIAGNFDYMLIIRTRDITHFRDVLEDKLSQLPGVLQTHSFTVVETVKNDRKVHLLGDTAQA